MNEDIIQHVQKYVPSKTVEREVVLPNDDVMKYQEQHYAITLVSGDQLTVAHVHGLPKVKTGLMVCCQSLRIGMLRCASCR